jgi:nucleoid-associated protein YgaU
VEEGDSLYRLAARYLGDGNKWPQLQKLNADQLGDSENVQVGMVIKIAPDEPAPAGRSAPARSQPANTSRPPPAPAREYVVLKGDNLGKISLKLLGTSRRMDEIVKLNNLKDPDDIRVGQSLKIPAK